ncbi:hypothetical protein [uncultured Fibrobacter sp.]|jgi:hypothetical protein|uniref:hypothetical protein n=1 Tax=uncultured Fibrobacter sp. TaxID=261512 RepID=UPI00261190C1|nr:hypothetical protein [uncultured Fibrobacter sp.]
MKKLMLLAALGAAAILTACGDDSSSGAAADGCSVTSDDTSVTMTTSALGYTSKTIWKIDGDNVVTTYDPAPEGTEPITVPKGDQTIETLKASAEESCKAWEAAEVK